MITTNDIGDILVRDCRAFGIAEVYRKGNVKEVSGGKLTAERIVILPKDQQPGKIWMNDFVEVNICVPDVADGVAATPRLQELERTAKGILDRVTGTFDGTRYYYSIDSLDGTVQDTDIRCHFVNVRLLFQVLNVN
jgi:hypothetical protein